MHNVGWFCFAKSSYKNLISQISHLNRRGDSRIAHFFNITDSHSSQAVLIAPELLIQSLFPLIWQLVPLPKEGKQTFFGGPFKLLGMTEFVQKPYPHTVSLRGRLKRPPKGCCLLGRRRTLPVKRKKRLFKELHSVKGNVRRRGNPRLRYEMVDIRCQIFGRFMNRPYNSACCYPYCIV